MDRVSVLLLWGLPIGFHQGINLGVSLKCAATLPLYSSFEVTIRQVTPPNY